MTPLAAVNAERAAQDRKWGEQNHEPPVWLAILTEEVGELAEAILVDYRFGDDPRYKGASVQHVREEATQVAAVAIAFLEYLDRQEAKP